MRRRSQALQARAAEGQGSPEGRSESRLWVIFRARVKPGFYSKFVRSPGRVVNRGVG